MTKKNLHTLLAILQQCEYDFSCFRDWVEQHVKKELPVVQPTWTTKLQIIHALSQCFFFLPVVRRFQVALWLLAPFDASARLVIFALALVKLRWLQLRGLKVIAIAGSFGKTSTKYILHHVLSQTHRTVATPDSFNTALGISEVILKKLHAHHQVFIVELGEFYPHHVTYLTHFVKPDLGILTPMGHQHLERFGTLENIVDTLLGLARFFGKKTSAMLIAEEYRPFLKNSAYALYGHEAHSVYRVSNVAITRAGTEFDVVTHDRSMHVFSPLFGEHQAINALPAFWALAQLHSDSQLAAKALATMPYIPHRHEPTFAQNNLLILDNGYNTNPDSMRHSVKLLNQLKPAQRILITLGFVELGKDSQKMHVAFGKEVAHDIDYLGLIESPATPAILQGFYEGGGKKEQVFTGHSQEEILQKLQNHILPNSVILLEGGYRELYT